MSDSFLPSLRSSSNHSLLGSRESALLCNQVGPGTHSSDFSTGQKKAVSPRLDRLARVPCQRALEEVGSLQALTGPVEALGRPSPQQIVYGFEYGNVDSKRRESAKQDRIVPGGEKRLSKRTRSPHRRIPATPILRNIFQM